jgi:hypothetical protein
VPRPPRILMVLTSHRPDCFRLAVDCLVRGGSAQRFDRVVVLANGVTGAHARYIDSLPRRHPDVKWDVIHGPRGKGWLISNLQNECVKRYPDALYFKIDEDVFVSSDWDEKLVETYEAHAHRPDLALISATIPNNGVGAFFLLDRFPDAKTAFGKLPHAAGPREDVMTAIRFFPQLAAWLTRRFLRLEEWQKALRASSAPRWEEWHAHFSINCICYDYRHWKELGGVGEHDEADWAQWIGERNALVVFDTHALCHHYTFFTQQEGLDRTSVLEDIRRANLPGTSSFFDFLHPALRTARQLPAILSRRLARS